MEAIPPHVRALSGSLGGIVEACCLQPIDVIKTRLQLDSSGAYRGIMHCGATVARTEGVRALWKGLTPFATHLTLKYALRMGSNALLQSAFKDSATGRLSNHGRVVAGFGAGVLEALVIVTPFEVIVGLQASNLAGHVLLYEAFAGEGSAIWLGIWCVIYAAALLQQIGEKKTKDLYSKEWKISPTSSKPWK